MADCPKCGVELTDPRKCGSCDWGSKVRRKPETPLDGAWWTTTQGISAKAAQLGIPNRPDSYWLLCQIAAATPGDTWEWIDPRNGTQARIIKEIRERVSA